MFWTCFFCIVVDCMYFLMERTHIYSTKEGFLNLTPAAINDIKTWKLKPNFNSIFTINNKNYLEDRTKLFRPDMETNVSKDLFYLSATKTVMLFWLENSKHISNCSTVIRKYYLKRLWYKDQLNSPQDPSNTKLTHYSYCLTPFSLLSVRLFHKSGTQ